MPGWANLTLVTDADLGAIEPQAIAAGSPWGATTWASARAEAKRELKIWIESAFGDIVGASDRILDRHPADYVFGYTGAAYTNRTTEATDRTEEDLALDAIFATPATDRIYIGATYQFEGLLVKLKDSLNAAAVTLTAKYFNGGDVDGWKALTITDGTKAGSAAFAQTGRITWTIPDDWERSSLNGTTEEYFWIELTVSAALTAGTAASAILAVRAPDGLKRVATYLALYFICNGLERQAVQPEEWEKKADKYWTRATDLFQTLKEHGGIPLDANRDQVVSRAEIQETQPVRLRRG